MKTMMNYPTRPQLVFFTIYRQSLALILLRSEPKNHPQGHFRILSAADALKEDKRMRHSVFIFHIYLLPPQNLLYIFEVSDQLFLCSLYCSLMFSIREKTIFLHQNIHQTSSTNLNLEKQFHLLYFESSQSNGLKRQSL